MDNSFALPEQMDHFSLLVKTELCARELHSACCRAAACYGIACFSKYFDCKGVVLHTRNKNVAGKAAELFCEQGIAGTVTMREKENTTLYEFSVKDALAAEKLLAMFGHTGSEVALHILPGNFVCPECFSAFAAAAFLCCGVLPDPRKGYSLEFVSPRYCLLQDFGALLEEQGFSPKFSRRRGMHVLYFKASGQIEDMLTFMGATKASLDIMNLKILREVRNTANRITNCETSNIEKMVKTTQRLLRDIEFLKQQGVLSVLPEALQDAAALRCKYPEQSLAELAILSPWPVSKSGLSHRFRRLAELAQKRRDALSVQNLTK